ncbi:MAG TPA: hypothetical protein DCR24_05110 [Bacillus bacterium]|nr:hypothetical protein [Bacillus sp. (in: firmicutes)]
MLLEIYAQSFDLTAIYSVYITLLVSASISAFWIIKPGTSFIDSCLLKIKLKPSVSETAYKYQSELGTNIPLLLLKRIKIKVEPGDEAISIFFLN